MIPLSRRDVFKGFAAFGMSAAVQNLLSPVRLLAQTATSTGSYKALVCIVLDGGCDSNNVVVPMDQSQYALYQSARPDIIIPRNSLVPFRTSSGSSYGINPALSNIAAMVGSGKCSVIANVGPLSRPLTKKGFMDGTGSVPTNLLDHELQKVQWGTCYTDTSALSTTHSGWGARMGDALSSYSAGQYPIVTGLDTGIEVAFCEGGVTGPALMQPGSTTLPEPALASLQILSTTSAGSRMVSAATDGLRNAVRQEAALRNALSTAPTLQTVFPNTPLGSQLAQAAQIMAARGALGLQRQIFMVKHGGFDTHAVQATTFAATLSELDAAVGAFQSALAELGLTDEVLTFTTSDFNRSLLENSGGGTDHAWGGHQLIFGGPVKSADMYGTFPDLTINGPDDFLGTGCWIPTTSVDQYGATLASWMGVPDSGLSSIFPNLPNFTKQKLGFV
jgi:uncharacterized protein (DUF1501 family)